MFEQINKLDLASLKHLYLECIQFSDTGMLPCNAQLRKLIKSQGMEDNALGLLLIAGMVYRTLAQRYIQEVTN